MNTNRINGIDAARFISYIGMVLVNFNVYLVAESYKIIGPTTLFLEFITGKAAATFVVLSGIGLYLFSKKVEDKKRFSIMWKRSLFLFLLGLINLVNFEGDILHFYGVYFLIGIFLVKLKTNHLIKAIVLINVVFTLMLFLLDYDREWNWVLLEYQNIWKPWNFFKNLFYNGWHPVFPWIAFLLFGFILGRLDLRNSRVISKLIFIGAASLSVIELLSSGMCQLFLCRDNSISILFRTSPLPPTIMFSATGIATSSLVLGLCLYLEKYKYSNFIIKILAIGGKQSLTLYFVHIIFGISLFKTFGIENSLPPIASLLFSFSFCFLSLIGTLFWHRKYPFGLLEGILKKLG